MKAVLVFRFILFLKWIQDFVLDPFLYLLFGYTTKFGSKSERLKSKTYSKSAQRVKIWTRGAYSVGTFHSTENFLFTHISYCHPNEVLRHDNITLQAST